MEQGALLVGRHRVVDGLVAHDVDDGVAGRGEVGRRAVGAQVERLVDAEHDAVARQATQAELEAGGRR